MVCQREVNPHAILFRDPGALQSFDKFLLVGGRQKSLLNEIW
jgi:hypothetical protein